MRAAPCSLFNSIEFFGIASMGATGTHAHCAHTAVSAYTKTVLLIEAVRSAPSSLSPGAFQFTIRVFHRAFAKEEQQHTHTSARRREFHIRWVRCSVGPRETWGPERANEKLVEACDAPLATTDKSTHDCFVQHKILLKR